MKVELMPGIASMSGSFKPKDGKQLVFKTFTRRDGRRETRAYFMEARKRRTVPSVKECAQRRLLAEASQYVTNLSDKQKKAYHAAWKASEYMFNGKKYLSFRGYVMARYMKNEKLDSI